MHDNGVTMTQIYELYRDLVTSITYRKKDGANISACTYAYNALGFPISSTQQRNTEAIRNDTFGYSTGNELTSATIGQDTFRYAFDNIGNRKTAQEKQKSLTYEANPLNQYTAIQRKGWKR